MRTSVLAVMLALAVSFLSGCGGSRHDPTEKYFLVATNVKLPYWQTANSGLVRAARQLGVLNGHEDWVMTLAISGDGSTLVSGSRDGTIRVWDARTWQFSAERNAFAMPVT